MLQWKVNFLLHSWTPQVRTEKQQLAVAVTTLHKTVIWSKLLTFSKNKNMLAAINN